MSLIMETKKDHNLLLLILLLISLVAQATRIVLFLNYSCFKAKHFFVLTIR